VTGQSSGALETARLRLRPYREGDLAQIRDLLCDERTTQHYPRPFSAADAELWLQRAIDAHAADGGGLHVIELLDDDSYVGHCGPMWQEVDGRVFLEIGWMVLPDLWGRGYAPEAAARWHDVLPERFGVEYTASIIGPDNVQSARVAAKRGLVREPATTFRNVEVELWSRHFDDAPPLVLRDATTRDVQGIAFAHVRSWQFAYRDLLPATLLDGLDVARRAARRISFLAGGDDHLPGSHCLVATRGEAVLGFADVGPSRDPGAAGDTWEIYAVYVRPDQLGCGVGAELLRYSASRARSHGAVRMTLWALAGNTRAARAYERAGWQLDGAAKRATIGRDAAPTLVEELRWARDLAS